MNFIEYTNNSRATLNQLRNVENYITSIIFEKEALKEKIEFKKIYSEMAKNSHRNFVSLYFNAQEFLHLI